MTGGLARRAEAANLAAWPALREVRIDGWLLRFSGGHTSRANAVSIVGAAVEAAPAKIAACAAQYRIEGLPAVFRLSTAHAETGLDAALDDAGYRPPRDASAVLHADLAGTVADAAGVILAEGPPNAGWLAASAALAGLDAREAGLRARMLARLAPPCASAAILVEGAIVAQALGAVHAGLVAINSVATAPAHRGRGLASRATAALMLWAAERHGAAGACLQVLADDTRALALYRRLGFGAELSRYAYRDPSGV